MFETLDRLYKEGRLSDEGLKNAVAKNWITPTQYQQITGNTYTS